MKSLISILRGPGYIAAHISILKTFDLKKVKVFQNEIQKYTGIRILDYFIERFFQQFEIYHFYRSERFKPIYWYLLKFYTPEEQDDLYIKITIGQAYFKITKDIFYGKFTYAGCPINTFHFRSFLYHKDGWPKSKSHTFKSRNYNRAFLPEYQKTNLDWKTDKAESNFRAFKVNFVKQINPNSIKERLYLAILKYKLFNQ